MQPSITKDLVKFPFAKIFILGFFPSVFFNSFFSSKVLVDTTSQIQNIISN
jgi:hypothetical protein